MSSILDASNDSVTATLRQYLKDDTIALLSAATPSPSAYPPSSTSGTTRRGQPMAPWVLGDNMTKVKDISLHGMPSPSSSSSSSSSSSNFNALPTSELEWLLRIIQMALEKGTITH